MKSVLLVVLLLVGCGADHSVVSDFEELPQETAREPITLGADLSALEPAERAAFWRAATWLNRELGLEVFAADAPVVHVEVRASRDCDLMGNTAWATRDYTADGRPVIGTAEMCVNFGWLLGSGAWAADRVIAHELLHTLGVPHDHDDPDSLMSPGTNALAAGAVRPHHRAAVAQKLR